MRVSVVVPARDAAATLGACLEGLAAEGVPGPAAELLVVDDASRDATRLVASRPGVRLLSGPGRGPAAARNLGARAATGEVLVFLDADTAPLPGWLREVLAPLADPAVVAVKGRYHSDQRALVARFGQLEFEEKYARLARAARVDFLDAGTVAFRRAAFLDAGGFDEGFPAQSAEDVDLAFRLAAGGARFAFNPRAGVLHRHEGRLAAYLYKKARYGFYRVRVYRRHPDKALGDAYTPPVMGLQIGLAGLAWALALLALARRRAPRRVLGGLAGVLAAFAVSTLPLVRRARADQPDLALLVPPLVLARATAQGVGILAGLLALLLSRGGGGRRCRL